MIKNAFIVDGVRTAIGKVRGKLRNVRPDDMAGHVIRELMKRNSAVPEDIIEDVIFGASNQAGEDNRNVGRMGVLLAGLPFTVGGGTTNRNCASGLHAILDCARAIMLGEGAVYIGGGTESMTRAPWVMAKPDDAFPKTLPQIVDSQIGWRFYNKKMGPRVLPTALGLTAENVGEKYGISREDQDLFAFTSQSRYLSALEEGRWASEIVGYPITENGKDIIFDIDEHPRLTPLEKLGKMKGAFREGGNVTAGNSSGINDGASACLLASEEAVVKYNLEPIARIVSMAVAGVDPDYMGIGPIPATHKALQRAGLQINDLGLVELNEAFAAQSLACVRQLGLDPQIVNVNGGAIALGHPLGCTGARIITTLLHEMKRRDNVKYALASLCVGVGQGVSLLLEKV